MATKTPHKIEAVMPPAVEVNPPVKIPNRPSLAIPSFTPLINKCPKPVKGTVAPAPAKSTSG